MHRRGLVARGRHKAKQLLSQWPRPAEGRSWRTPSWPWAYLALLVVGSVAFMCWAAMLLFGELPTCALSPSDRLKQDNVAVLSEAINVVSAEAPGSSMGDVLHRQGSFDRCALVGSSLELVGKGLGPEIDGHTTVIRVNRLPTRAYHSDFGKNTDVYFIQHKHARRDYFLGVLMGDGANIPCEYRGRGGRCSVGSVVMGADIDWATYKSYVHEPSSFKWEDRFLSDLKGSQLNVSSRFPVGFQVAAIAMASHIFNAFWGKEPTSGFHAFLLFTPICRSLRLYGFSGGETADQHEMWEGHPLSQEHGVIDRLVRGAICDSELRTGAVRGTPAFRWLRDNLPVFSSAGRVTRGLATG